MHPLSWKDTRRHQGKSACYMSSAPWKIFTLSLLLLLAAGASVVLAAPARPADNPLVKVRLGLRGPYTVRFPEAWTLNGSPMAAGGWRLLVGARQLPVLEAEGTGARQELPAFSRLDAGESVFVLNGHPYRGALVVRRYVLVNELGLEEYLCGVVAREIGGAAQLEALKAQAVVARTYALAHLGRGDFADDSSFQVYQGTAGETLSAIQAVNETRGQVLAYGEKIARNVCYHSTCGGHTEDNEYVFRTAPVPYLRGVKCLYSSAAPGASAPAAPPVTEGPPTTPGPASAPASAPAPAPAPAPTPAGDEAAVNGGSTPGPTGQHPAIPTRLPSAPATQAIPGGLPAEPPPPAGAPAEGAFPASNAACSGSSLSHWTITLPIPASTPLEILERTPSGRVARMRIGDRTLEGDDIRRSLRFQDARGHWVNLYSTAFRLTRSGAGWRAEGWGWGHGVGMCQWGARGMARAGRSYADILAHYFPGTVLATVAFAPTVGENPRARKGL